MDKNKSEYFHMILSAKIENEFAILIIVNDNDKVFTFNC